jgi:CelD/BcsL family acetyltransferase involved in cellulose biosynthesis
VDDLLTRAALLAHDASASVAAPQPGVSVEWLAGREALDRLAPVWDDVVARARLEHPFATHEWISSWWQAFGQGAELRVLVARRGASVDGLATLMRRPGERRWQTLHNAHTPRVDWPVDRASRDDTFAALWQALRPLVLAGGVDVGDLPESSATLAALAGHARRDGLLVGLQPTTVSPVIDTRGTWDTYLTGLSGRHRQNMRCRLAKLARQGEIALEFVSGGPGLQAALEHGLWLEAAAWKRDAGTAIVTGGDLRTFYTALADRTAARGWLRLIFLTTGGRRVAFAYGLHYGPRLFLLKIGYDPAIARLSPGQLLFWCLVQHACANACLREVDLLGAFDDWKRLWTRTGRGHARVSLYGRGLRARAVHALRFRARPWVRNSALFGLCRTARVHFRGNATGNAD